NGPAQPGPSAVMQLHDQERGNALARTGLSNHRHGLARTDAERDILNHWGPDIVAAEGDRQVFHTEQGAVLGGIGVVHRASPRGSRMSLRPSPSRLTARTVSDRAAAGR